jgi:CHASE3 domain sensor protein
VDQELKQHLTDMETRINGRMDGMETRINERMDGRMEAMETRINERMETMETRINERMVETMRDMQTELLRGMAAYSESVTIRVRKLEADHSNLDAALSGRVDILERRLGQIEQRLGLEGLTH